MFDEVRVARERLMHAEEAKLNVEEAQELAKKKKELLNLVAEFKYLAHRREVLQQGGVQLSMVGEVDKVKQLCGKILDRFIESPKNETLMRNKGWINLLVALKEFNREEESQQKHNWKEYFAYRLFGGLSPEQRKQTLTLSLPVNKRAFERYERVYQLFSQHKNTVPNSIEQLVNVQTYSEELVKINSEFVENDNVPLTVQEFFAATVTTNGASLELLTEEVIIWLRANNMINNYAVRTR